MMSPLERYDLDTDRRLMIFGASTRAAAQSAVRAGWRPQCADLFADEDLKEVADVLPLADYPEGLLETVAKAPSLPWIYTGALENRPALLNKLAASRLLWGNPGDVAQAVRNPFRLFAALKAAGLPALAVWDGDSPPPADGQWVLKPWAGSAGRGIQIWQPGALPVSPRDEPSYFQQKAFGRPISALFLSTRSGTALVGVTEQLIGLPALSAGPFAYCGSVGPIAVTEPGRRTIERMGEVVAANFGLRGLFGIDLLVDREEFWPTEINPRYTASVEIHERVLEVPLLEWHIRACQTFENPEASGEVVEQFQIVMTAARAARGTQQAAKAVVFAPFAFRSPDLAQIAKTPGFAAQGIEIADRPAPGTYVGAKSPLCTLIAKEAGAAVFQNCLATLAGEFERNRCLE